MYFQVTCAGEHSDIATCSDRWTVHSSQHSCGLGWNKIPRLVQHDV